MARSRFTADLIQGHNDVTAVIVPFDPREAWGDEPIAIDPRREGWLVRGTMNGAAFEGWIGYRWGRHFIMVEADLRAAAEIAVGDPVEVVVAPTTAPSALAKAREQAKATTAPRRRRC